MRNPLRNFRLVSLLVVTFLSPLPLRAWGALGHKTIACIAQDRLNPRARIEVRKILGQERDLPSVSTWADAIVRERPETAPWHYLNLDVRSGQGPFELETACRQQDGVVVQIEKDLRVLREPFANKVEKREALKFLIHFVGDLHQPLHCADDQDRGGNEKWFKIPRSDGKGREGWESLHAYWDDLLGMRKTLSPHVLARELESKLDSDEVANWPRGTPGQWAYESFLIAQNDIYDKLPSGPLPKNRWGRELSGDYTNGKMKRLMEQQLLKAGIRLAYLLNDTLGQK
jgi:hypothetical protein